MYKRIKLLKISGSNIRLRGSKILGPVHHHRKQESYGPKCTKANQRGKTKVAQCKKTIQAYDESKVQG